MGIVGGGAYAEYVTVPAEHVFPVPEGWSFDAAATVPEAVLTAHDALRFRGRLEEGERLLVHAVGSGVGVALLQLAKAWGATVAGTSRTPRKLDRATELGLDRAIRVATTFQPRRDLRDWADVICDLVGGAYVAADLEVAAPSGRIVVIGLTGGAEVGIDLRLLLAKRLTLVGTVLRSRSREEKASLVESVRHEVMPLVPDGRFRPVLDSVFPMEAAADAHRYLEENRNFGAVVLRWEASSGASG